MHLFLRDFVTSKNKQMTFSFLIVLLSGYTFIIMCANGSSLTPVLEHTNKRYAKLRTALKANENSLSALHVIMGPAYSGVSRRSIGTPALIFFLSNPDVKRAPNIRIKYRNLWPRNLPPIPFLAGPDPVRRAVLKHGQTWQPPRASDRWGPRTRIIRKK